MIAILGNSLQLPNLFVEVGDVLIDHVGQLLNRHPIVVKDGFLLCHQGQFLKFSVRWGYVFADTPAKMNK